VQLQLELLYLVLVFLLLHGHLGDGILHAQLLVTPQDELFLKVLEQLGELGYLLLVGTLDVEVSA